MKARNLAKTVKADAAPEQSVADWACNDVEVRALLIYRKLSPKGQQAFLQAGRRMADGMPVREAALLAYQEAGMSEAEIAEALATLPAPAGKA